MNELVLVYFSPTHQSERRSWTKQTIVAAIQERHRQGLPIRGISRHDSTLEAIAVWHFGGWSKAVEAAGEQKNR